MDLTHPFFPKVWRLRPPELLRRGLHRCEYRGCILRGHLGLERPGGALFAAG